MSSPDGRDATDLLQPLVGRSLQQLCVGPGEVQLLFVDGWWLQLESTVSGGMGGHVVPYGLDGLGVLQPLLGSVTTDVAVDAGGELSLTLGATTVRCPADAHHEAWTAGGPDGTRVVCLPGGGVARWAGRR